MEINWKAMEEAEKRHIEKSKERFDNDLKRLTEEKQKDLEFVQKIYGEFLDQEDKAREKEMLRRIEEEKRNVEKKIIKEYEKDYSASWNEGKEAKALKEMARELFGNPK